MTKMKASIYGIMFAAMVLFTSVFSVFGIQELIKAATGWNPPKWLCVTILGLGAAGAIAQTVASFGVTLPKWAAIAASGACSVAA